MKRREYLSTVGVTALTPALPVSIVSANEQEEEVERKPVYYTVDVPSQDLQLVHISAPTDLLASADWIFLENNSVRIHQAGETTDEPWEIVNVLLNGGGIDSVRVGDVEADRWDTLEMEQIAFLITGSSDHSFLEVVGNGQSVSIQAAGEWWINSRMQYMRSRVETNDVSEVSVETLTDDREIERVPIFEVNSKFIL